MLTYLFYNHFVRLSVGYSLDTSGCIRSCFTLMHNCKLMLFEGKVLGNIAMRGVMFGICVTPDNERHRSLTVNVLQGEQQEHR